MNITARHGRSRASVVVLGLLVLALAAAAGATVTAVPHQTLYGIAGLDTHGIVAAWTSDHGGAAHFKAFITWGDGLPATNGKISSNGAKSFDAQGTHVYLLPGTFYGLVHVVDSFDITTSDIAFTAEIRPTGLIPTALTVDEVNDSDTDSDVDGVFEFGESVVMSPSWSTGAENLSSVTGTLSDFHRVGAVAGETYTLSGPADKATADYGSFAKGDTHDCFNGNDSQPCYKLSASLSGDRPVAHMDAQVTETLKGGEVKVWTLHLGGSFTDVGVNSVFYRDIESLFHNGVTVGCAGDEANLSFCPAASVTREQMAAFMARAILGSDAAVPTSGTVRGDAYNCAPGGSSEFSDVAPTDVFCRHIHYIASQNLTFGCGGGNFCGSALLPRGEAAIFIARAQPPVNPGGESDIPMTLSNPVNGRSYDCNVATANVPFSDVPATSFFCKYVNYIWALGIVDGFPDGTYGPGLLIRRDEASKLVNHGFQLKLYQP